MRIPRGISSILLCSSVFLSSSNVFADASPKDIVNTADTTNLSNQEHSPEIKATEEKQKDDSTAPTDMRNSLLEIQSSVPFVEDKEKREQNKKEIEQAKVEIAEKMPTGKHSKTMREAAVEQWEGEMRGWGFHKYFVLKHLKDETIKDVVIPSYIYDSHGYIVPCYLNKEALKGNRNVQTIRFSNFYEEQKGTHLYDLEKDEISQTANGLFSNMPNLQIVDFAGVDLQGIIDFSSLFANDSSLKTVKNIYLLNVSQGLNFDDMFNSCVQLKNVELFNQETHQRLDFSNGEYFIGMFENCQSLENISFWGMNFTHAKTFKEAFKNCTHLYQVELSGLPDGVDLEHSFYNSPLLYAELSFEKGSNQASNTHQMFYLPNGVSLPLLIRSNSKTFTNTEIQANNGHYTYHDFAEDGRILPSIMCSGEGGLFKDIMGDELKGHVVRFDIHDKEEYIPKNHWKNAKFSILDTTNGFVVDSTKSKHNPIDELKNLPLLVKYWSSILSVIPTFQINQEPYYEKDVSRFVLPDYKDETEQRWKLKGKFDLSTIPDYLKGLFAKYTAQYAPFNPEMAPGHTIDTKYPKSTQWPKNRTPQGELGFCYQPSDLTVQNEVLLDGKKKEVPLISHDQQNNFHLGIRDYAQTKRPWLVNATLHWQNQNLNDVAIKGTGGIIRKNMNNVNNRTNAPKPFKMPQLNNYTERNVQSLVTNGFLLQANQPVQLMKADGKQANNFYDLGLGKLMLSIPQENQIPTGSYDGQIEWNLTVAPNG